MSTAAVLLGSRWTKISPSPCVTACTGPFTNRCRAASTAMGNGCSNRFANDCFGLSLGVAPIVELEVVLGGGAGARAGATLGCIWRAARRRRGATCGARAGAGAGRRTGAGTGAATGRTMRGSAPKSRGPGGGGGGGGPGGVGGSEGSLEPWVRATANAPPMSTGMRGKAISPRPRAARCRTAACRGCARG